MEKLVHMQKFKIRILHHKQKLSQNKDINIRLEIIKLLNENIGLHFLLLVLAINFFGYGNKAQTKNTKKIELYQAKSPLDTTGKKSTKWKKCMDYETTICTVFLKFIKQ